jgi:Transposase DDE domain
VATTIPQVARAMREVLTTTADATAKATQFVRRTSPLGGATFSQTLVFGFLGNPQASLEELAQTAATLGVPITPQALDQRFTPAAAACLAQVLRAAITRIITADPVAIPLLERFTAVCVQDSSTIVLPDTLAAVWQGCGGTTTSSTAAALKLQVRLELRTGQLEGPQLQDGRASDRAALLPTTLPSGALWLADLGYWSLNTLQTLDQQGVCWLSRLQVQTAVYDTTGQQRDLLVLLEAQPTEALDLAVELGETHRQPARLLAVRVPPAVANERRRRLRAIARKKGRTVSARRLALAAWTMLVTNVPAERLTVREALVLGRARWQIAFLFKLRQSPVRVDESRRLNPWCILCEVYAKLLVMGM